MVDTKNWWQGSVIYQVYPRSFLDSNQDGVGDLAGITDRLDYIAQLGVDAIWISPFFPSPMKDFGYDVTEHKNVDPLFGNLDDFAALVSRANAHSLKIMIDLVVSHTSDQHRWFHQSRSSRDNEKSDWYVWADAKPDGSPPNNWLSLFGGSAWEWDATRRQFYLHNFLTSQPDLNFYNPDVVEEVLDIMKFWLRLGVSGFRMDTVNWYFHDQELRDNPPNTGKPLLYAPESSNYVMQEHIYNKSRPESLPFMEKVRALLDEHNAISLGELTAKNALELTPIYTKKDKRLNMVYTFSLLTSHFNSSIIRETIREIESNIKDGYVCIAFSNHDVVRAISRWRDEGVSMDQQAKFLMALMLSLRGAVCLYQGEELALPEADIAFDDLQDPYGIRLWPEFKGRDGCRTPMPWHVNMPNGGFSTHQPWLPISMTHLERSVDIQEKDTASMLHFTQSFIKWRKDQDALVHGDLTILETEDPIIAFERATEEKRLIAVFNASSAQESIDLRMYSSSIVPIEGNSFDYAIKDTLLTLQPYTAFWGYVKK